MIDPRKYAASKIFGLMTVTKIDEAKFIFVAKRFSEETGAAIDDERCEITIEQVNKEIADLREAIECRELILSDLEKQ